MPAARDDRTAPPTGIKQKFEPLLIYNLMVADKIGIYIYLVARNSNRHCSEEPSALSEPSQNLRHQQNIQETVV